MNDYETINADKHAQSQLTTDERLQLLTVKVAELLARVEQIETHLVRESYYTD